ncbi:hypothetical protein Zmor_018009 [Zophobas morio]|uniref:Uncharacterized protein n=1 Tax=Zophobas morio TaxID=2755281 RepID=A0AA38IAL7_9CUCU|nr:hypothetical protein Zmor_018009 [Zophobas morio]
MKPPLSTNLPPLNKFSIYDYNSLEWNFDLSKASSSGKSAVRKIPETKELTLEKKSYGKNEHDRLQRTKALEVHYKWHDPVARKNKTNIVTFKPISLEIPKLSVQCTISTKLTISLGITIILHHVNLSLVVDAAKSSVLIVVAAVTRQVRLVMGAVYVVVAVAGV